MMMIHRVSFALLVLLAVLFSVGIVTAATRYVSPTSPSPGPDYLSWDTASHDIQSAIDVSGDGDLILVGEGVYDSGGRSIGGGITNRVAIDQAITVRAFGSATNTFIVGSRGAGSWFSADSVRCAYVASNAVLDGFTLTNGYTGGGSQAQEDQHGGGAFIETNGLVMNCVITGCRASYFGGGIYGGAAQGCRIENCRAGWHGGGAAYGVISSSTIANCYAPGWGGGLCRGAIVDSTISSNYVDQYGGGIFESFASNCLIEGNWTYGGSEYGGGGMAWGSAAGCTFVSNHAAYRAGGAYWAELSGCVLSNNTAGSRGGAGESCRLDDCLLTHNYSLTYGGALTYSSLTNCRVENNLCGEIASQANGRGGGLYSCTAVDTRITSNQAMINGGGTVDTHLTNCIVAHNIATNWSSASGAGQGGGMAGGSMIGGTIASNRAHYGGGASSATLIGCAIQDNVCNDDPDYPTWGEGGGTYWCTLRDCTVERNYARNNASGGGVARGSATGCRISYNTSDRLPTGMGIFRGSGGGAYMAKLTNCFIWGNFADGGGGGVASGEVVCCTIYSNSANAFGGGGGIYGGTAIHSIIYFNSIANTLGGTNAHLATLVSCCTEDTVPDPPAECIVADPQFDFSCGLPGLLSASPCIDAVTNSSVSEDHDGVGRPLDGDNDARADWDIGAREFAHVRADSDRDGMTDAWEVEYGLNAIDNDAVSDADGDRINNWCEFVAGTHPGDEASFLHLLEARRSGADGFVVSWPSVVDRCYRLARCDSPGSDEWTLVADSLFATPPVNTVTDVTAVVSGVRLYRIEVQE